MLPTYRIYGCTVGSAWALPCPEERVSVLPDIELVEASRALLTEGGPWAEGAGDEAWWFRHQERPDGSLHLCWSRLFEFFVSPDGRRIEGRPLDRASEEAFRTYLLGPVLSFALIRQGIEPLHATAVVLDGVAVGFLGDSGDGKSTLAAAFLQAGVPLLTDDLLVTEEMDGALVAHPGLPRIKLFPEIAGRLLGDGLGGTPMNAHTEKLVIPLPPTRKVFWPEPAPLRALYALTDPPAGTGNGSLLIRRLSARRAFLALTQSTFNTIVAEPSRLERQFTLATRLATTIPVKHLAFPRSVERLTDVRNAILEDLGA